MYLCTEYSFLINTYFSTSTPSLKHMQKNGEPYYLLQSLFLFNLFLLFMCNRDMIYLNPTIICECVHIYVLHNSSFGLLPLIMITVNWFNIIFFWCKVILNYWYLVLYSIISDIKLFLTHTNFFLFLINTFVSVY